MTETVSLVEKLWAEADRCWKLYNETPDEMDARKENMKGRMRGLAFSLVTFMTPHFQTEDDIVREIIKRGKFGSEYETPGIGSRRYEAPPGSESKYKQTKAANPGGLTDEQVSSIKARNAAIPAALLASGYGVKPEVIEAVRAMPS